MRKKENVIKKGLKAHPQGIYKEYTKGATLPLEKKNLTSPQSYNLAKWASLLKTKESEFTTKQAQEQRENTKALFSLIRVNSSFSNTTIPFLQIAQKRQRGAALQIFLSSLLTGILFHPIIRSLTRKGGTQAMPKAANREVQIPKSVPHRNKFLGLFPSDSWLETVSLP